MSTIIENISLKKLSWLAALPVSLAAFSASIVPAQANEYNHHETIVYDSHSPDYTYCTRWEYRHEYRCVSYYKTQHKDTYYESNHNDRHYDKWDYRYQEHPRHHDSYYSNWGR